MSSTGYICSLISPAGMGVIGARFARSITRYSSEPICCVIFSIHRLCAETDLNSFEFLNFPSDSQPCVRRRYS